MLGPAVTTKNTGKLETYRAKRKADQTPEPFGPARVGGSRFVVQQHAARRMHYDFRLELDGVLKSWAVPKGPSPNPADKRLAVHVEDHPVEYANFEGMIPPGNYGAGAVIVWDRGRWVPLNDIDEGFVKGKLLFELRGYKLRGKWTLVKTKRGKDEWLLIKERDALRDSSGHGRLSARLGALGAHGRAGRRGGGPRRRARGALAQARREVAHAAWLGPVADARDAGQAVHSRGLGIRAQVRRLSTARREARRPRDAATRAPATTSPRPSRTSRRSSRRCRTSASSSTAR